MHQSIYTAMLVLASRDKPCSVSMVYDELRRKQEAREETYDLLERYESNFSITKTSLEAYTRSVVQAHKCRRLISAASQIVQSAYAQDEDVVEQAEQLIYEIALEADAEAVPTLAEVKTHYMRTFEQRVKNYRQGILNGVPTGFRELDEMLDGLQPSDLYIMAARPSLGKTSLALCIALHVVKQSERCLFFSLEQNSDSLFQRLLGMETPIDQSFLRAGYVNDQELEDIRYTANDLARLDMLVDERTYTLNGMRSKARREHARKPLRLIVIDYLQFMDTEARGRNEMRYEEVGKLTKGLKRLARELKVPVLLLAQLSREVENRSDLEPHLSDLSESSKIEMDADTILFAYAQKDELKKKDLNEPYKVSLKVAKQRNGRLGKMELWFRPRITKFQTDAPEEDGYARV
jgi:replicative DNA helicase